jgi:hypothetical protein
MPTANYQIGDTFPVQFVWKLPGGDYLRAVFEAKVLHIDDSTQKYVVKLQKLVAGRQESESGEMRPVDELARDYWRLVGRIPGKRVSLAFEVEDGRPLWLRLTTLTGEHRFFDRLSALKE